MKIVLDCRSVFEGMGGISCATAGIARSLPRRCAATSSSPTSPARAGPKEPLVQAPNVTEVNVEAAMLDPAFEQIRLPGVLGEPRRRHLPRDVFRRPNGAGQEDEDRRDDS